MAFDFGAAGGGAALALQDIIKQKLLEQQQRAQIENMIAQRELQARGQNIMAEGQRATQTRFDTERADKLAAAEKEAAATAAADAERKAIVGRLSAISPQVGRLVDMRTLGFNINDPHAVESEQEHAPHVQAARTAELSEFEEKEKIKNKYNPPAPRDERLVQVEGPDGRATWVREGQAVGKPAAQAARAVTGAERGVLAYYNRAKDAEATISAPDPSGRTLEDRVAKGGIGTQLGLQYAPNMLQTGDQQAYRQAQRAFTEARLRKESGAAIPTSEYENDAKTYFAQPGDKPEIIEQKRRKRQTVLEGLKFSSGRAYDEFYGEQNKPQDGSPKGKGQVTIKSITEIK